MKHLVVAAAAALGVGRVVVIGSSEEYGEVDADHGPIDESTPLRPMTPCPGSAREVPRFGRREA